jgi:hypothetical protein
MHDGARVMDGNFIAYYRVSTDRQGMNGTASDKSSKRGQGILRIFA